jgi:DNA polymerase/3'-5' exonuclease PolX
MNTRIPSKLRRIADDIDAAYTRIADTGVERSLEEMKKKFIENFHKANGLEHLDPEKIWNQMQDSIRQEIKQKPRDWRA